MSLVPYHSVLKLWKGSLYNTFSPDISYTVKLYYKMIYVRSRMYVHAAL